jgi:superfamily II DNA or RNA helicase
VVGADRDAKRIILTALSYTDSTRPGAAESKSTFFDFRSETFDAGFLDLVYRTLVGKGYKVRVVRKEAPKPLGDERPVFDSFGYSDARYDYQPLTVDKLIKFKRMIAQIATGGGKSRVARMAFARINRPTLFLTTRQVLMYQMKEDFEECGFEVGVIGDSNLKPIKGFNVATMQTFAHGIKLLNVNDEIQRFVNREADALDVKVAAFRKKLIKEHKDISKVELVARLKKYRNDLIKKQPSEEEIVASMKEKVNKHNKRRETFLKLLAYFQFVIIEEAHEAGGDSFYDVLNACKNAHYRLALTATPFMRDDEEANMRLMAVSGPVTVKVTEKMLIDSGILAKPYFKFERVESPSKLRRGMSWQKAYKMGIMESEDRNAKIIRNMRIAQHYKLPIICLVQRKEHGRELKKLASAVGISIDFIFGESKHEQRKKALNSLKSGAYDGIIGSTILDVGVDVPAVGMVILAGGGKAEVATRQRIGRGLRAKKHMANVCFIVDFVDNGNDTLMRHYLERRRIIESTPGFAEGVVEDFDFSVLNDDAVSKKKTA